jgi:hypothetical protein
VNHARAVPFPLDECAPFTGADRAAAIAEPISLAVVPVTRS